MNSGEIHSLLHGTLGIKKEAVALKLSEKEPETILKYTDMNNICYMMAEALEENKVFYTTLETHVCLLGCAATGLDPALTQMNNEQRSESDQFHTSGINIFPTEEIQQRAEKQADELFPKFSTLYKAVIIGRLGLVADPDALVLFGTPEQIHLLTRAYCYATGSIIRGFAGMGVCRMLLPFAFIDGQPSFSISDRAWRRAFNLAPDELTLVTPPAKLEIMLEYLEQSR
ncbi:MAG: DUF169 domain-containing protein [Pseudomonadota bacterium]